MWIVETDLVKFYSFVFAKKSNHCVPSFVQLSISLDGQYDRNSLVQISC